VGEKNRDYHDKNAEWGMGNGEYLKHKGYMNSLLSSTLNHSALTAGRHQLM
jgi:hypothetical protein